MNVNVAYRENSENPMQSMPRGLPRGFDLHLQKSRKAFRCQRTKVSGLTMVKALFRANNLDSKTRVSRVARLARRHSE